VLAIEPVGDDRLFTFDLPPSLWPYLIPKGSVALDGVSLTIVDIGPDRFRISMMPYTLRQTVFGQVRPGYRANLEADVLGKYAARLMEAMPKGRLMPAI
jgi:riboflavin synthase